jgi:hypothetical protein
MREILYLKFILIFYRRIFKRINSNYISEKEIVVLIY